LPKLSPITLRERDELEPLLVKNPDYIEEGLRVLAEQLRTDSGPLDILALDSEHSICVIELKDAPEDEQLFQGIRYYDWVKSNIAWLAKSYPDVDADSEPRLLLIAPQFSDNLRKVAKYTTLNANQALSLKEYHAFLIDGKERAIICSDVEIGEAPEAPEIPSMEIKIEYIQSEKIRQNLRSALGELEGKGVEVKPIRGHHMTGWYRQKRFLFLSTRQQWFVGRVQSLDGAWSSQYQIASEEQWRTFFDKEVKPIMEAIGQR
jgi:hypothetical protein